MPSMSIQAKYNLNFVFLMRFMGRMKTWKSKLDSSSLYNRASLSARFLFASPFANIHKYLHFLPKRGHLESTWIKIKRMESVVCPLLHFISQKRNNFPIHHPSFSGDTFCSQWEVI